MIHTKLVLRFLAAGGELDPSATTALHTARWDTQQAFLDAHSVQATHVARAMPLDKVFKERKSAIAEGMQLSPALLHDLLRQRDKHFEESGVFILPFLMVMNEVNLYLGVRGSQQKRVSCPPTLPLPPPTSRGNDEEHDGHDDDDTMAVMSNLSALQKHLLEQVTGTYRDDGWEVIPTTPHHTSVTDYIHRRIISHAEKLLTKSTDQPKE
jgi:hypothetical protein